MLCPCKDCDKKGCGVYHDECQPYQEFVKWKRAKNDEERKEKQRVYSMRKFEKKRK